MFRYDWILIHGQMIKDLLVRLVGNEGNSFFIPFWDFPERKPPVGWFPLGSFPHSLAIAPARRPAFCFAVFSLCRPGLGHWIQEVSDQSLEQVPFGPVARTTYKGAPRREGLAWCSNLAGSSCSSATASKLSCISASSARSLQATLV